MPRARQTPGRHDPRQAPRLRGKLTVEIGEAAALTEAGADLLSQIDACRSLSEAARRLGFSYRRAWMLVDAMNRRWPTPLVTTSTGGKHGGGSTLTDFGLRVLRGYRDVQLQLEAMLDQATTDFQQGVKPV